MSELTTFDYIKDVPDNVKDCTNVKYVAARIRQFIEKRDMTQDDLLDVLKTTPEGLAALARCIEPAAPGHDHCAPLLQISELTGITFPRIFYLWSDPAEKFEFDEEADLNA